MRGFDELLPSWNVRRADGAGFLAQLRVAGDEGPWSPWMQVGLRGAEADALDLESRRVRSDEGRVVVDVFRSSQRHRRLACWSSSAP